MKRWLSYHETYVFIVIVLFSAVIAAVNPSFLTLENLFDLLKSYAFLGILSVGVLFVLISGGIDISFTAVATVAMYVMAVLIIHYGGNIAIAFLIAATIGIALELINALIIYYFNIPAIITTIATLNIYYGLLTVFSGGKWIYGLPPWFREFADIRVLTLTNEAGVSYGISIVTVIWFVIMLAAWGVLRYTVLGRSIYAFGGNPGSAERIGINILRLQLFVYGVMGLMAGIAGVVQVLLVQTVAPNSIVGKELDVIAAVVLGGASLFGGTGSLLGTLLGVALIAVMSNGLTLMRVPSYWYDVFIGLIILFSVTISALRRRQRIGRMIIVEGEA
ncbi:MAG: ABC transporter permease [Anaerolineae bacterium]|nr:ABC transporter permease [Anaerolineae bacterium]MDW8098489.1 ABC transporter permease [Anaerolineae bacterium]